MPQWYLANLFELTNSLPMATGRPFGYMTDFATRTDPAGTARVVYLGSDAHVHELRLHRGIGWTHTDLSAIAGAPPALVDGEYIDLGLVGPTAYVTPFDFPGDDRPTIRVLYFGADGHIHEIRLSSSVPGWTHADLSLLSGAGGGYPVAYTGLDAYTGAVTARVLYVEGNGVHELRLSLAEKQWMHAYLSQLVSGPPPYVLTVLPSPIMTYHDPARPIARVYFSGMNDNRYDIQEFRLEWGLGVPWQWGDISEVAGVDAATEGEPFAISTRLPDETAQTPRVYYSTGDFHLHELRLVNGVGPWLDADLSVVGGLLDAGVRPLDPVACVTYC